MRKTIKHLLTVLLVLILIMPNIFATDSETIKKGDMDGDGKITIIDVRLLLQLYIDQPGEEEPSVSHLEGELERGATLDIEVPEASRKEISNENAITWEIDDNSIVYFGEYDDFTAKIVGKYYGETKVRCKQGDEIVAEWDITVTGTPPEVKELEMELGEVYAIGPGGSIEETNETEFIVHFGDVTGATRLTFEPNDLVEVIDYDGFRGNYIIKGVKEGTFTVTRTTSSAGSGPVYYPSTDGHAYYKSGGGFSWVDVVSEITVKKDAITYNNVPGNLFVMSSKGITKSTVSGKTVYSIDLIGEDGEEKTYEFSSSAFIPYDLLNYESYFNNEVPIFVQVGFEKKTLDTINSEDKILSIIVLNNIEMPLSSGDTYNFIMDENTEFLRTYKGKYTFADIVEDDYLVSGEDYFANTRVKNRNDDDSKVYVDEKTTIYIAEPVLDEQNIFTGFNVTIADSIDDIREMTINSDSFVAYNKNKSKPVAAYLLLTKKAERNFEVSNLEGGLERRSTLDIEVPTISQKEISAENAIRWEIDDEDIVYFNKFDDFTATIVGKYYGETKVRCKQGGETVAEWDITVTGTPPEVHYYEMELGELYEVTPSSVEKTDKTSFGITYVNPGSPNTSLLFEPSDMVEEIATDHHGSYILKAVEEGVITVKCVNSLSAPPATSLYSQDGHAYYGINSGYSWVDVVAEITIK